MNIVGNLKNRCFCVILGDSGEVPEQYLRISCKRSRVLAFLESCILGILHSWNLAFLECRPIVPENIFAEKIRYPQILEKFRANSKIHHDVVEIAGIFDKEKLKELAATIADVGVLQPILVRPKNGRYEIIAGERRWKATQIAGIDTIPALIKELPDSQVMVESLIENVHRANLKPMEQAKAILEVFKAGEKIFPENIIDNSLPQKINNILSNGFIRRFSYI